VSVIDDIAQLRNAVAAAAPSGVAAPADDTDRPWVACDTCRDHPGISPYSTAHDCPAGCKAGRVWDGPDIYRGEP